MADYVQIAEDRRKRKKWMKEHNVRYSYEHRGYVKGYGILNKALDSISGAEKVNWSGVAPVSVSPQGTRPQPTNFVAGKPHSRSYRKLEILNCVAWGIVLALVCFWLYLSWVIMIVIEPNINFLVQWISFKGFCITMLISLAAAAVTYALKEGTDANLSLCCHYCAWVGTEDDLRKSYQGGRCPQCGRKKYLLWVADNPKRAHEPEFIEREKQLFKIIKWACGECGFFGKIEYFDAYQSDPECPSCGNKSIFYFVPRSEEVQAKEACRKILIDRWKKKINQMAQALAMSDISKHIK